MHTIETKRLGLRNWKEKDIEPFINMNGDKDVMKYFPKTLSRAETIEAVNRINQHFEEHGFGLFAIEEKATREFIGFTGFSIPTFNSFFTPCVEIGWRLKKEVWKKGFATEAAKACLNYGFEALNFDKIVSFTSVLNTDSEKVMQRIGMSQLGFFDHPKIENGHLLCKHVLYEIFKPNS